MQLPRFLFLTFLASAALALPTRAVESPVLVEICESGLNNKDAWPEQSPAATENFRTTAFALDALPHKYVEDGVRGARPSPFLMRVSATVDFPAGHHKILVRSRSAARLFIDGKIVAENPFPPSIGEDGSEKNPQRLIPIKLGDVERLVQRGEFEKLVEFETSGGRLNVALEAFVGGRFGTDGKSARRAEPGETVVAVLREGSWDILTPSGASLPLTEAVWGKYRGELASSISKIEAAQRAKLRETSADYWKSRRAAATQWLASTPETPVPALPEGAPAFNAIDRFLAARLQSVVAQNVPPQPGAADFFKEIKPLLEGKCVECHRGAKAKAGLRLDSRETALAGSENGVLIVPAHPEKSDVLSRIRSEDPDEMMPPKGERLSKGEQALLSRWISEGVSWPELPLVRKEAAPLCEDLVFLRRAMLDTVGVPPTPEETRAFTADASADKRVHLIDRLLADPRGADHWMGFWQDALAENPNILNPTLNNTGPFRWWLYEALSDDLPLDRMVTQLVRQGGSERDGGPAGFSVASQNDAPFAAKGTIISSAFLGVEMKCARCHDSPSGSIKQEQLFQLGALLATKTLEVPTTSSVDPVKLHAGGRKALIAVTLLPGSKVEPRWPFAKTPGFAEPEVAEELAQHPEDPRDRLAALLTAPQNERFAQVLVNRLWQRLMGRGIVEPVDNWEKGTPTHPELLHWMAREFVRSGYQLKPVARLILNSHAYQRATDASLREPDPLQTAPAPRRLSAEQVVDSLYSTTGKPFRTEPVCLDLNGRRDTGNALDLGNPTRAWMMASLSNERDRPSLTLPRLQAVTDVLSALGWRGARQDPVSVRDIAPNTLQPAILANGMMSSWLTRLSDDHGLTAVARDAKTPEALVETLFMRMLTRPPTPEELRRHSDYLRAGFESRLEEKVGRVIPPQPLPRLVTWSNHLLPESTTARQEDEAAARAGDPPTPWLYPEWRQRCEDVIWALINSPEMLFRP